MSLTKTFTQTLKYGPSVAMTAVSSYMAYDGFVYDRFDVFLGGLLLATLGGELFALARGENRILGVFKAAASEDSWLKSPGNRMATIGLAACVALGGGELVHYLNENDLTLNDLLNAQVLEELKNSPSFPKLLANATAYPLVSILDFKSVGEQFEKRGLQKMHRYLQTISAIAGALLILRFGEAGKIFSAKLFGQVNAASGYVSLGQISKKKDDPLTQNSPQ